jgi:hypothetical protein
MIADFKRRYLHLRDEIERLRHIKVKENEHRSRNAEV